jgi:Ion channel
MSRHLWDPVRRLLHDWRTANVCQIIGFTMGTVNHHNRSFMGAVDVGFICAGAFVLNWTCIKTFRQLFSRSLSASEVRWEYGWFFATAFLNIFVFAAFFRMFGLVHGDSIVKDDWSIALYFSLITWTTVGYGDFVPTNGVRLLAGLEALVGYFYMALLVGVVMLFATRSLTRSPKEPGRAQSG